MHWFSIAYSSGNSFTVGSVSTILYSLKGYKNISQGNDAQGDIMHPAMCGFKKLSIPTHRRTWAVLKPVVLLVVGWGVGEGGGLLEGQNVKSKVGS